MSADPPTVPEPPASAPSPRTFILGLACLLLLVELLLTATAPPPDWTELRGREDVRALLRELAATPEPQGSEPESRWLLLGDSVLVGNTGAAELPDWASHRIIDYLRSELGSDEAARFEQVALDGMIPADMLALVEALDAEDPEGEVALLVELSPRHFSPSYADEPALSRPWLAEIAPAPLSIDALIAAARRVAPIYRHRRRARELRDRLGPGPPSSADPDDGHEQASDRLAAFARLSVHYRESVLAPDSVQVAALVELVARCRARGRRVVLFTTPLEDRFAAQLRSEAEWGAFVAQLDRLLEPDGEQVALLPMDHPMFASALFWDHVHLRPEGHRLLALNLLAQIGLGLERAPPRHELLARPGFDTSLVARIERGASEGAAWQARFDRPEGLALAPGGRRLVLADTFNHVLRELHGDMRVVSTLAGKAGERGERDGAAREARLNVPSAPVFVGDDLYFADGRGRRLRRLVEGEVTTLVELPGSWRIQTLRAGPEGGELLSLEARRRDTRLVVRGLDGGERRVLLTGGGEPEAQISAFCLGPAGELYFATRAGEIRRLSTTAATTALALGTAREQAELVFGISEDAEVYPQGKDYPRPFAELRLSEVVDLAYVEPYGGLLVQDYAPHPKRGRYKNPITERAHLRFLDLERELVYPWVKPLVVGFGYAYKNTNTRGFSSYFHEGSMALDPETRALYYLESARSRLLRIEDGIFGLAKISSYSPRRRKFKNIMGEWTGEKAFAHYRPGPPPEPTLAGPYELLLTGSSMTSMSELVSEYSLARMLFERIARELALRDRVRVHGFQRSFGGGALSKQIGAIERFLAAGGRPDLILIDVNGSDFITKDQDQAEQDELLAELVELAARWDSKLVFFDTSPYIVRNREPLHPGPARVRAFMDRLVERGFEVVRVADAVLDRNLEVAPFATPPVGRRIHPPTWAVDASADALGAALVPIVREVVRGRTPALERDDPIEPEAAGERLAAAFAGAELDWDAALAPLPEAALQYSNVGATLVAFIDLGAVPEDRREDLDALVLACIYERSVRFGDGARAAEITIGRFTSYDEYGVGVEAGATIVADQELDFEQLRARVLRFAAARD